MRYMKKWLRNMGHTYDTAAVALGVSRSQLANYVAEKSRTNGKPCVIPSDLRAKCESMERDRVRFLAETYR